MGRLNLDDWQKELLNTKGNIILVAGRQTGKSTIISIRDGERAARNSNESILIIAPTERQSEEIFTKTLIYLTDNYPQLIMKGKKRPTKHVIHLKNGSIIRCFPVGQSGVGIRGYTLTKLTMEEASYLPEEVWTVVTPMLITTGGDMDLLGTPHGQIGFFWKCYKNEDNRFKVFHVNTEQVMKNRPISETWTEMQRKNALEYLEQEKKSMSTNQYAQEYLGMFIADVKQLFSDELIKRCCVAKRPQYITRNVKHYLGVDIARMGEDEGTFEIIDRINEKKFIHVENIITRKKLTTETEDKIIQLEKEWNFTEIDIDSGAGTLGVSIFDHLLNNDITKRKIVAINNRARPYDRDGKQNAKLLKEDLYNNLLGLMQRGELILLDDDEVKQSLKSVQYEYLIKMNKSSVLRIFGNYTHVVEGLIRAAWAASKDKRLNIWVR